MRATKHSMTKLALIRCDASPAIGFGHLVRCLALAAELSKEGLFHVVFMMRESSACDEVRARGFAVHLLPAFTSASHYEQAVVSYFDTTPFALFIGDVRDGLPTTAVAYLRRQGVLTVAIDEPSDYRKAVDLVFYPPIPQIAKMNWDGFTGKIYAGWQYVIIRSEFSSSLYKPYQDRALKHILVSCGGSDPANMALRIVQVLLKQTNIPPVKIVVGPAAKNLPALRQAIGNRSGFEIITGVSNLAPLLSEAKLAVISFGVTAYECASLRVPALHYCLTPDHCESAEIFAKAGMAINCGLFDSFNSEVLSQTIQKLLHNNPDLLALSDACVRLPDSTLPTIVATINAALEEKNYG